MIKTKTERGFEIIKFKDYYGTNCSLQQSSIALSAQPGAGAVWLGTDDTKFTIFEDEKMGKYIQTTLPPNFSVSTRMHLDTTQVIQLVDQLQHWLDTGEFK